MRPSRQPTAVAGCSAACGDQAGRRGHRVGEAWHLGLSGGEENGTDVLAGELSTFGFGGKG